MADFSEKPDDGKPAEVSAQPVVNVNGEDLESHAQTGVLKVEAATSVWTKDHLIAAYIMIWLIYFITSTQETVVRGMDPYVTSAFRSHSLTAATGIVASIVAGLVKLPLAKILDLWGRPQGLASMLLVWVIGYIMMAGCNNVKTYAAAQVFSSVGSQGVSYCLTIFIADTSSLKNRSLVLAFATSPYIATTWIGGPISQSLIQGAGWRWGFGIWAIVVPVVVAPLCILFFWNHQRAKAAGLLPPTHRKFNAQSIKQYIIDIDLIGIIILAGGMALFLLPFSLWSYQRDEWRSPMIICMIIFGGLLLIAFAIYERFVAPVAFVPFRLLLDRTVFFGGLMFVFVFASSSVWGAYFYSMLQVVYEKNITQATYISSIYRVGSCLWALAVGVLIRWSGRFKWLAVYFAIPLMLLAEGLMIHFRFSTANIGYVVMTQIFNAFAGGTIVICGEMAMMAPSDHQHIAAIIAILDLFSAVGSAVGGTVATAIWTATFPKKLRKYLPADAPVTTIYTSLNDQLSYAKGTAMRDGINHAYSDAQRIMLIVSTVILAVGLFCAALWRDIKVKDFKQTKGLVA